MFEINIIIIQLIIHIASKRIKFIKFEFSEVNYKL